MNTVGRIVMGLALVAAAGVARGEEELARKLEAFMDAPPYAQAHWGVLFVDQETGETIYARQSEKLFAPASVTKVFTVATALDALGADHRFVTPVYRRGEVDKNGTLEGDLILVASGDPTLGGRTSENGEIAFTSSDHTYAMWADDATLTAPDPLAGLKDLARQVSAAGIRKIHGDVLIDDRLFASIDSTGSGPKRVTPIMVNDNVVDITITPGEVGQPATVTHRPETALVHVAAEVETVAAGEKLVISIRSEEKGRVLVSGKIPATRQPLVRHYEAPDAAAFARGLLIEALREAGVETRVEPESKPATKNLPGRDDYPQMARVAQLESPPFAENARLVLKVSHNLHASTFPLLVGLHGGGKGTLAEGLHAQRDFLNRLKVDADSISFGGGAGGARSDYVTPRVTVDLLRAMTKHRDFAAYERAFPILGVDGTLASAISADSPLRGKVRAKTGTLTWDNVMNDRSLMTSKALAGYMTTAKGRKVVFALFVNGVHMKEGVTTRRAGSDLARICEMVYESR